jgi:hypothetical protein
MNELFDLFDKPKPKRILEGPREKARGAKEQHADAIGGTIASILKKIPLLGASALVRETGEEVGRRANEKIDSFNNWTIDQVNGFCDSITAANTRLNNSNQRLAERNQARVKNVGRMAAGGAAAVGRGAVTLGIVAFDKTVLAGVEAYKNKDARKLERAADQGEDTIYRKWSKTARPLERKARKVEDKLNRLRQLEEELSTLQSGLKAIQEDAHSSLAAIKPTRDEAQRTRERNALIRKVRSAVADQPTTAS